MFEPQIAWLEMVADLKGKGKKKTWKLKKGASIKGILNVCLEINKVNREKNNLLTLLQLPYIHRFVNVGSSEGNLQKRGDIMAAKPLIGRKNSLRPCVKHFSHSHPLRPVDVKEEEEIICSGCELDLSGSAYKCTKSTCDFFLHKSCFELPRELEHTSHPQHLLVLLSSPPGDDSKFTCNACGDYGTSFAYHCATCQFNLHVGCAFLPKTMKHVDHNHPLTLLYSTNFLDKEGLVFTCDVCRKEVSQTSWVYYCLDCDYGTDLHCTTPSEC
jgi:hypothetical protein